MNHEELETFLALPQPTSADIPQELVWHVAAGLEDPAQVALRFGYEGEVWEKLKVHPPFVVAVSKLKSEFEASGFTQKQKFRLMAGDLSERLFAMSRGPDASISQLHELLKTMAKLGGLEPAPEKAATLAVSETPKFSISINIGAAAPQNTTIDVTPMQIEEDE